jgi:carbon-monoxide dehydrogenase small subunit
MNRRRQRTINLTVNGQRYEKSVSTRKTLADFLRQDLNLTGTHIGCEHGVCGACTIILNDHPVRSCLLLAVQADACVLETIEGMASPTGDLHPLQQAFQDHHALQCGFCTPGFLLTLKAALQANPDLTEPQLREAISGNLCRCTGYQQIIDAALHVITENRGDPA